MKQSTHENEGLQLTAEELAAKGVVRLLQQSTEQIDDSILARLEHGRNRAVQQAMTTSMESEGTGVLRLFGEFMKAHRFVAPAAMVCSVMVVAFIVTQQLTPQEVSGQGDAFLLGSELPPEAYFDRGFDTWLAHSSPQ